MADLDPTASRQALLGDAPPAGVARLLVFGGSLPVAHDLPMRGRFVLGRGGDIAIDHVSVSRAHEPAE